MSKSNKNSVHSKSEIIKAAEQDDIDVAEVVKIGESQLLAFWDFIRTQGVVGLAVGLVLGGSVAVLVKSLVDNIVMPPVGLLLGSTEGLKGLSWIIKENASGQSTSINYGIFLNDFINFIVIALVVYIVIRLLKFDRLDKKKS